QDSADHTNGVEEMQLFDFPTANEIPQELMEIKDEPIDDFTDAKDEKSFFDKNVIGTSDGPLVKRPRVMEIEKATIDDRFRVVEPGIKEEDEEPIGEPDPSNSWK
ncbi:hypothetical protein PMAYCL1PPCAC_20834, partial [Pristionchus mayeri]